MVKKLVGSDKKHHFIHIPKNGGVSFRKNLGGSEGKIIETKEGHLKNSIYTKELRQTMKPEGPGIVHARWRDLNDIAKIRPAIAVVRNPWTRAVSRWKFIMDQFKITHGQYKKMTNSTYQNLSFEAWLEERHTYGKLPYYWHRAGRGWYQQKDYVTDEEGNLKVACLRLEHLDSDVAEYFQIDKWMKPKNVTNKEKLDYRSVYTPKTRKIIEEWYAEDIEFFGFDFDSPATKNVICI